ncbi:C-myc promoter-binding protein-like isoform X2 [Mytilus galloprovincialis]|uniref:C-myc promoter-binding protein-like isoform X2 n=1 Tax=Mytilus galloprovincialis TaxID=29158 RepID=UPI003F7CB0BD
MDERRVADYFVVVGLPDNPLPLEEISNEAAIKSSYKQDPITDICIINKSLGEKLPKNYTCIAKTSSGFPADLNHGSIRCHELYICYRRSREKPPLIDVGVLYEGKERLMPGCEVCHTTAWGSPANVNNSNNGRIYITFRRAKEEAASDTLSVVDICVILSNKNENPPHAYHCIEKNLNKGMIGSDVFICYKKAVTKADLLAYKPAILDRYPIEDYESFPLPDSVPMFCLPMGASIECWSAKAQHPLPIFSTFVLTGSDGEKVYGAAVQFYEEFEEEKLSDLQMRHLGLKNKHIREQYRILKTVHSNKCICLLSHWPFFDAFRLFLTYLYRNSITGPHTVPLERHISHFMYDVPYPSPQRPNILVQLSHEAIILSMPEDSPLPQSGASFITMLKNLGPENCMNLLLYILHEQKVLIHSLRPAVLTGVAEAVINMIFPLHWQCPYIPLCPLGLSYVLSAPVPFIVGIDSRYFDLYDPPSDVVCVDLDTITISLPDDKKNINYRNLPKKPARVLQETLHKLFDELCTTRVGTQMVDEIVLELAPMEHDFRMKRKETLMELRIQEAFLRFQACVLKGYRSYLKPITRAPTLGTTDVTSLFDMQGFLKSRDKANSKFYQNLTKTQTFIRFLEERSFVSDNDASLAFFDECTEKVNETLDEPKLIELDGSHSERTVYIMPPEPVGLPEGAKYSYNGFPTLKTELFLRKKESELSLPSKGPLCPNSPISRRSKQEIRSSQKMAQQYATNAMLWAKCLLSHCYSLWFIHLPAFLDMSDSTDNAMKVAYDVLQKMQLAKLQPPDEVCYRVMLQLCGQHNMPVMAVKVLYQMKRAGVQPNAITYGYYNKAVFEGTWPTTRSKASVMWKKIRNVIIGVAQFRRGIRRRSVSICSYDSEYDGTSLDSLIEEHQHDEKISILRKEVSHDTVKGREEHDLVRSQCNKEESASAGGISDRGYSSMTHDELKTITEVNNQEEITPPQEKVKKEVKGSLRFNIPKKQKNITSNDDEREEGDEMKFPAADHSMAEEFRQRMGSIVRKSLGSVSSSGSKETLIGSTVSTSSAGLLMVSSQHLEDEDSLHSLDRNLHNSLNLGKSNNSRKRHKSAGDYHTKPRSTNGAFTNWRPRHVSGDDKMQVRLCDLTAKEDDLFIEESDKLDGSFNDESTNVDDTKDSGVVLDTDITNDRLSRPTSIPIDTPTRDSMSLELESPISRNSIGTPVTENDPLGFFDDSRTNEENSTKTNSNVNGKYSLSGPQQSTDAVSCTLFINNDANDKDQPMFTIGQDKSECNKTEGRGERTFSLGSVHSLDCTIDSQPLSPLERVGKRLKDVGRTNSSPGGLDKEDKSGKSNLWPVKGYLSSLHSPSKKSNDSLDGTPELEGGSESRFKRLGSFRKHKERLSGAFKFGAGALANKFSELKQTITTPTKFGSNSSIDVTDESRGIDVPKRHSMKDTVDGGVKSVPNRQAALGSLVPSSSFIEQYIPLKEFGERQRKAKFVSLQSKMSDIAMEVEICSTCRCAKCRLLLYDEEIMAGWSADDSNLNTTCIFCSTKLVPNLQIYTKDWRGKKQSELVENEEDKESDVLSSHSGQDPWVLHDQKDGDQSSLSSLDNQNAFFFPEEQLEDDDSMSPSPSLSPSKVRKSSHKHLQATKDSHLAEAAARSPSSPDSSNSSVNLEDMAQKGLRRRCASECFTSATDNMMYGSSYDSTDDFQARLLRSPLRISIGEEEVLPSGPDPIPEMKRDFMDRCTSSLDPISVPYLSPIVLRKELENILSSEGDLSLISDNFLDEHPIIFWNLVWYFKRIEVPSHLPGFLLTAKSINKSPKNSEGVYTSQHVLFRPQWDNLRIHEEVGLPMYKAWNEGYSSHIVDALVTEAKPFNRAILHQIITSIQCNDLLSPIKMVMNCRRRLRIQRSRHRSIYRDILFLALVACGRENIDCDAFDREFRTAFLKLSQMEMKRTQRDDRPRKTKVIWCRKVFGELEV